MFWTLQYSTVPVLGAGQRGVVEVCLAGDPDQLPVPGVDVVVLGVLVLGVHLVLVHTGHTLPPHHHHLNMNMNSF